MKRLFSFVLIAATALSAAACSDSTGPAASLSGSYTMRTLGGQQLPATLFFNSANDHVEILASTITLNTNGSYSDVTRVQDTNLGRTSVSDQTSTGSWSLTGTTLTLQDALDYSNVTYADVSNNQLVISQFSGYSATAVYQK